MKIAKVQKWKHQTLKSPITNWFLFFLEFGTCPLEFYLEFGACYLEFYLEFGACYLEFQI